MLKIIDQFGTPIQLSINNKMKYTTSLGGFFTCTMLGLTLYFAVYFGQDMVMKQNPNLINYKSYVIDNNTRVNNSNFFLAFQVVFPNNSKVDLNSDYFQIDISSQSINSVSINQTTNKIVPIKPINCNISDLKDFNEDQSLKNYIVNEFTCMELNNVLLSGSPFHNVRTTSIKLNVNFAYFKFMKEFGSEMNLYIKGIFPLTFRLFYQSYSYDADNYSNPFKKELAFADMRVVLSSLSHLYGSFIRAKSIRDDDMLFSSKNITYLYGFQDFKVIAINNMFIPNQRYSELFKSFLYLDYYEENFIRSYNKVQDIGAQVFSITKMCFFMTQFLLFFYSFNRINEQLAYRFFKYIPEKNIKSTFDYNLDDRINHIKGYETNKQMKEKDSDSISREKINSSNLEYNKENKILASTNTLPKIFLNSIFTEKKQPFAVNKTRVEDQIRKSIHKKMRKMAIKFNFVGSNLIARRKSRGTKKRLSETDRKSNLKIEKTEEFKHNSIEDYEEKQEIKVKVSEIQNYENPNNLNNDETKKRDIKNKKFLTSTNTRVFESSLRVNNQINQFGFPNKRKQSFKLNNDKGYILEGEDEDAKNNANKVIKNFSEQDLTKPAEKLGFLDKFIGKVCCSKKINSDLKMKLEFYQKASKKINEKIDIVYFLNNLEEFQKFKILFLNPYQNIALRYSKKANIFNINLNNVIDYYERFCNSNDHGSNIKKIMEYFTEKIRDKSLDLMDQKLFEILDGDLKKAILMSV